MKECLIDPNKKRNNIINLFSVVAPKYNLITKILSFNQDIKWKRQLVSMLPDNTPKVCLDLATGTGDIAILLSQKYIDSKIVGIDNNPEMLMLAKKRNSKVIFLNADMCHLKFEDESVDFITGGYALRNAYDLNLALLEIKRVLKPSGSAIFLDFCKNNNSFIAFIQHFFLKIWGNIWGLFFHGKPQIYGYIADSLKTFPSQEKLQKILTEHELTIQCTKRYMYDLVQIMVICKQTHE